MPGSNSAVGAPVEGGEDGGDIMKVMLSLQVQSSVSTTLNSLSLCIASEQNSVKMPILASFHINVLKENLTQQ